MIIGSGIYGTSVAGRCAENGGWHPGSGPHSRDHQVALLTNSPGAPTLSRKWAGRTPAPPWCSVWRVTGGLAGAKKTRVLVASKTVFLRKTPGPAGACAGGVLKNLENQKGGVDPWGDHPAQPLDSEVGTRPGVFEGGGCRWRRVLFRSTCRRGPAIRQGVAVRLATPVMSPAAVAPQVAAGDDDRHCPHQDQVVPRASLCLPRDDDPHRAVVWHGSRGRGGIPDLDGLTDPRARKHWSHPIPVGRNDPMTAPGIGIASNGKESLCPWSSGRRSGIRGGV